MSFAELLQVGQLGVLGIVGALVTWGLRSLHEHAKLISLLTAAVEVLSVEVNRLRDWRESQWEP